MIESQTGFELFKQGIFDSLLLFLVIPFSIPTFIGYHLLVLKRIKPAIISFAGSFLIGVVYLFLVGLLPTLIIFAYVSLFYFLIFVPFWILEKIIAWYDKKFIYDKYHRLLREKREGKTEL